MLKNCLLFEGKIKECFSLNIYYILFTTFCCNLGYYALTLQREKSATIKATITVRFDNVLLDSQYT